MARSSQQQRDDFVKANDKSLVVSGYAIEPNPHKSAKGAVYKLADGSSHRLSAEACSLLPENYPKWDI